jgi:hypothetical protein
MMHSHVPRTRYGYSNDETHPGRSRVGLVDRDQLGDGYVC